MAPVNPGSITWDSPGFRWDRPDLFWDLDADNWLVIPYWFGPAYLYDPTTPDYATAANTEWLDANFTALILFFNARREPTMPDLTVPWSFAGAGLNTPTARLDANFKAVYDWVNSWPGRTRLTLPYLFRNSGQNTPLSRLDVNFQTVADWWNHSL